MACGLCKGLDMWNERVLDSLGLDLLGHVANIFKGTFQYEIKQQGKKAIQMSGSTPPRLPRAKVIVMTL